MKIEIIEKYTGKVIYTTEVHVKALNYEAHISEYNAEAWIAAVEDGVLNDVDKSKYAFQVLKD
jgi:hypothetical protein